MQFNGVPDPTTTFECGISKAELDKLNMIVTESSDCQEAKEKFKAMLSGGQLYKLLEKFAAFRRAERRAECSDLKNGQLQKRKRTRSKPYSRVVDVSTTIPVAETFEGDKIRFEGKPYVKATCYLPCHLLN